MVTRAHLAINAASILSQKPTSWNVLQRKCACGQQTGTDSECEHCRQQGEERLQRAAVSPNSVDAVPPIVHEVLRTPGEPLDAASRTFMESRFGHDFSRVRVHTNTRAAESAQAVQSLAYTVGRDVVFGSGQYAPGTSTGRRLLAHELTHVIQQGDGRLASSGIQMAGHEADEHFEREADRVAHAVVQGGTAGVHVHPVAPMIQRQAVPTGIKLAEAKPFGHGDLKTDELMKKYRTYVGSTTLMQVTPAADYTGHCVKEYLSEVSNTCPARFAELRPEPFCTESKCLDFARWGTSGDASTGKMVTDGPDTFVDRHRTSHDQSLLEGSGKDQCSVVCHQRYKFDRQHDLGSFYIIRNFRASTYKPTGSADALHITTGEVKKVTAALEAPSKKKFAKDIAPGLKQSGALLDAPPNPKGSEEAK